MRTGAAEGHTGFFHETALYGSDDELLDIVVPFLEGGVSAGEPTVVSLASHNAALVRRALPALDGITYLSGDDQYARPASSIRVYRDLFGALAGSGADQIRVVGEVPQPGVGVAWDGWARYEAAINHAYDEFPVWGMCAYDTRTAPTEILDDVERTHQHVATADGRHRPNERYEDPVGFLRGRPAPALDPLERTTPGFELWDPAEADARHAVVRLPAGLPTSSVDDLAVSVSEIVTNARRHGRPPVRVRGWAGRGRAVVTVHDTGPGVTDPFAGLLPANRDDGGRGLWIAHQLCSEVSLLPGDAGFGVRLVVDATLAF